MHEWALAEAAVETVRREAAKAAPGARVKSVRLAFGELQQVDRDIFEAAVAELAPEAGLDAAAFAVEIEAARFSCRGCGRTWGLAETPGIAGDEREAIHLLPEAAHAYVRCPGCGSADFDVAAGRGVSISSIEVEEPGAPEGAP